MTAQINDTCFHRKIDYKVSGISGTGLFEPTQFGLEPKSISTACWRGYVAHYSVINGQLFLSKLHVGFAGTDAILARNEKGPELFGVVPKIDRLMGFLYEGLEHPVSFTGGLLLADGFIRELYVHMGFHPAWKYQSVREVIFDGGRVTHDDDRSAGMAELRAKFLKENTAATPGSELPSRTQIEEWVKKCFSREY